MASPDLVPAPATGTPAGLAAPRPLPARGVLRFGVFELDLASAELRRAGVLIKVRPQPLRTLALLAVNAPRVLTRDELRRELWDAETFVDFDQGLNYCIKEARATLGDNAEMPAYIETLLRRGYRWVGPEPTFVAAPAPQPAGAATLAPGRRPRLAIAALLVAVALALGVLGLRPWRARQPTWQRLTFRRGTLDAARFAPGGEVAYSAAWDAQDARLFVGRRDVPDARLLEPPGRLASVSSRGETLFIAPRQGVSVLARTPLAGGPEQVLAERVLSADATPDGTTIALLRFVPGKGVLAEFPLGTPLSYVEGGALRVSPDGRHLALLEQDLAGDDGGYLIVFDRAGRRLFTRGRFASLEGLAWRASGDEVWFSAAQTGADLSIWAADLRGRVRLVLPSMGRLVLHDLAADGRALVERAHVRIETRVGQAQGPSEADLSWFDSSEVVDLSDDGRLALISESGEASKPDGAVYLRSTSGAPALRLGSGRATGLSPDGRWALVVPLTRRDHIDVLPTGPGAARRLTVPGFWRYDWADFTHDGRAILLVGAVPGQSMRVYLTDLEGRGARPITPEGRVLARNTLSPDGRYLAARCSPTQLCLFPVAGGAPVPVPGRGDSLPLWWSADGRHLFVADRRPPGLVVERVDLATGRRDGWRELRPPDPVGVKGIGRVLGLIDGRAYAYTFARRLSELYEVEGLR